MAESKNGTRDPLEDLVCSPYLSLVGLDGDSGLTYATHPFQLEYPVVTPPSSSALAGVVGLDRHVRWIDSSSTLDLLISASKETVARSTAEARVGLHCLAEMESLGWLVSEVTACEDYNLVSAEIEITTTCNWRCSFCPVSIAPKKASTMDLETFSTVIGRLTDVPSLTYVTYHFFNEPTLDSHLVERTEIVASAGLQLALYTNGSRLTRELIAALVGTGALRWLVFNLPASSAEDLRLLTRSHSFDRVASAIDAALDLGVNTQIVVNGLPSAQERVVSDLTERFDSRGAKVVASVLSDRAGEQLGKYSQGIRIDGMLNGCGWPVQHLNVAVDGSAFLCCNDYHQRYTLGSVIDQSVDDIMRSPAAVGLRRQVFGFDDAPSDLICRSCHNQQPEFPIRDFRPIGRFS
jgi:pyruvate-formate lyase-activating enzyme